MNIDSTRKFLFSSKLRLALFYAITWGGLMLIFSGDYSFSSIVIHIIFGGLFGFVVSTIMMRRRPYELEHFRDGDFVRMKQFTAAFRKGQTPAEDYDKGDYAEFLLSRKRAFTSNMRWTPITIVLFTIVAVLSFVLVQSMVLGIASCGLVALNIAFLAIAKDGTAKADRLLAQIKPLLRNAQRSPL